MTTTLLALALTLAASPAVATPPPAQAPVQATHPNGEVALVVDFEVKPGFENEVESVFARSSRCSRLEPGNVAFNIHRVINQPGRYVLYEIWRSPAALENHFQQPYTVALFALFDRALKRPITDGGLRFIGDLNPAERAPSPTTNPQSLPECR